MSDVHYFTILLYNSHFHVTCTCILHFCPHSMVFPIVLQIYPNTSKHVYVNLAHYATTKITYCSVIALLVWFHWFRMTVW